MTIDEAMAGEDTNNIPVQPTAPTSDFHFKLDPSIKPAASDTTPLTQDQAEAIIAARIGMGAKSPDGSLTSVIGAQQQAPPGTPLSAIVKPLAGGIVASTGIVPGMGGALAEGASGIGAAAAPVLAMGVGLSGDTEQNQGAEAQQRYLAGTKALLDAIYKSLPKQALYQSVLTQLDGSHLLAPIAKIAPQAGNGQVASPISYNGVVIDGFAATTVPTMYSDTMQQQAASITDLAGKDPQAQMAIQGHWLAWQQGDTLHLGPDAVAAANIAKGTTTDASGKPIPGSPTTTPTDFQSAVAQASANGAGTVAKGTNILTMADLQQMIRSSLDPLSTLKQITDLAHDQTQPGYQPGPNNPILGPDAKVQYNGVFSWNGQPVKSYGALEASNLLYTLKPDELTQLESNLRRAGYFQAGSDSSASPDSKTSIGPFDASDPGDPKLERAWKTAIADSIKTGTPILTLLNAKASQLVKQGVLNADGSPVTASPKTAPAAPLQLEDTAKIKVDADAMAAKLLGRYLQPQELDSMVQFIHGLEAENQTATANAKAAYDAQAAAVAAGNPNAPLAPGASAPIENVDESSRMQQYLDLFAPINDLNPKTKPHPLTADELKLKWGFSHLNDTPDATAADAGLPAAGGVTHYG